ncbi:MAG: 4Fe-4S dicluster domain-containing protein [bacterium]
MPNEPIRVSQLDRNFRFEVAAAHPCAQDLNACFTCGTCSAGCPIHRVYPEYDPVRMLRMIHLGMRRELLSSECIWYCATCHTCELRCPQKVKFFDILNILRNLATQGGYAPAAWLSQVRQLRQTGLVFPTEEAWVKKRKELSLRPVKCNGERIARLLELAGLDNSVCPPPK